jgi:sporadic carbohydrate cluster 2OG-Fe(II) oxygenase
MFLSDIEKKISEEYLTQGYVVKEIEDLKALDFIKDIMCNYITSKFPKSKESKKDNILNNIHKHIAIPDLNQFRLDLIDNFNSSNNFRESYYKIAKPLIDIVVGNEVAMQLRAGLSIQLPDDDSSLLPVHADTWSGVSPFETVVWLPLVNCFKTKSMYILPPNKNKILYELFLDKKVKKSQDIYRAIKKDLIWLDVKYGQVVIFDHSLPHGNVVNEENETRWSMNCRFKSIFTPYADKRIGEYYEPITLRAASKRGIAYKHPKSSQ